MPSWTTPATKLPAVQLVLTIRLREYPRAENLFGIKARRVSTTSLQRLERRMSGNKGSEEASATNQHHGKGTRESRECSKNLCFAKAEMALIPGISRSGPARD
jgi:hypothetical protein